MKHKFIHIICFTLLVAGLTACTSGNKKTAEQRYTFNNILDIAYTPDTLHRCYGWFTDAGSWMGFTLPEKAQWVNGFCGPFSLDMFRRQLRSRLYLLFSRRALYVRPLRCREHHATT